MCADVWNQDQETWWICSSEDSNFQFIIEISVITWIPTDSSKKQIYVFCTEPGIWSLIMNRHHSSVRNKQFTSPDEVWSFYNHLLNGCLLHWKIARYLLKKKSSTCLYILKEFLTFIEHTIIHLCISLCTEVPNTEFTDTETLSEVHQYLKSVYPAKVFFHFLCYCK